MIETVIGGVVAIFTGYTAFALWRDRQDRLQIFGDHAVEIALGPPINDWTPRPEAPDGLDSITLEVTIKNKTARTIRLLRWRLDGIPLYGPNSLGIERDLHPDQSGRFALTIFPDWVAWESQLDALGTSSPKWRASVIIERNTLMYAIKSLDARFTTTAATIIDSARKIKVPS